LEKNILFAGYFFYQLNAVIFDFQFIFGGLCLLRPAQASAGPGRNNLVLMRQLAFLKLFISKLFKI
jgi:hypothetical protein